MSVPRAVCALTALRTRRERSIAAPRATSRIRGWAPPGLYDKRGSTHTRDCLARCDYESDYAHPHPDCYERMEEDG
jgi:hypothetical protein